MDWLDLLPVQGTLKSLLYHSSKASVLRHSAFFIVQLSYPYMTPGKNIALTRWTFVGKVMSLLFNKLSRFVITFLPRNKRLLISWLQSLSAVILEPQNIKSVTVSFVSPSICYSICLYMVGRNSHDFQKGCSCYQYFISTVLCCLWFLKVAILPFHIWFSFIRGFD